LCDPNVLEEAHIEAVQRRTVEHVPSQITERPDIVDGKCRRAKPYALVGARGGCRARAGQLRPIVAETRQGIVAAALDVKWRAGLVLPEARPLPAVQQMAYRSARRGNLGNVVDPRQGEALLVVKVGRTKLHGVAVGEVPGLHVIALVVDNLRERVVSQESEAPRKPLGHRELQ